MSIVLTKLQEEADVMFFVFSGVYCASSCLEKCSAFVTGSLPAVMAPLRDQSLNITLVR